MTEIESRRIYAAEKLKALHAALTDAAEYCHGKACVYVTGSYGRLEACAHSDLDLFILGKSTYNDKERKEDRSLTKLNEICVKADLIHKAGSLGFDPFSGDGEYLQHYTFHELTEMLGKRQDDAANTFTARLLLLLESRPLIEPDVYWEQVENVISVYFEEFEDHKSDFMPAFLINDILRLWRTFCVNYESSTKSDPLEEKIKRKIKNYKLKHSRLLTCYSAIMSLLAIYSQTGSVTPSDMLGMVKATPLERLQILRQEGSREVVAMIDKLVEEYEKFLSTTNRAKQQMEAEFSDAARAKELMESARIFGDTVYDLLHIVGGGSKLHRLVVV